MSKDRRLLFDEFCVVIASIFQILPLKSPLSVLLPQLSTKDEEPDRHSCGEERKAQLNCYSTVFHNSDYQPQEEDESSPILFWVSPALSKFDRTPI